MQNRKAPGYAAFELWPIHVKSACSLHKRLWGSHCVPGNSQSAFFIEVYQDGQEKPQDSKAAFPKSWVGNEL